MPDLPTVSEAFEANIGPFVAAIHEMQDELLKTAGLVKTLQEYLDSLHGKTIDINTDTGGSAGLAALQSSVNEVKDSLNSLAAESAIDSAVMIASLNRVGDAATEMAAKTVAASAVATGAGWRPMFGWLRLTGTTVHWLIAGTAEFLSVFIPAMVAAGGAAAVMAQGVGDVKTHLTAMYDAQEATANIFHTTVGDMLGLGHALQAAQNAADPRVFELLGAGINIARTASGAFVKEGTQVVGVLDNFAAKATADMQGAMGKQLHDLLSGGVRDLTEFGQVLGNLGHAVLNFASAMPGLAGVLLAIVDGASKLIEVFSSMPGSIITGMMALEEFNRWGSVLVGGLGRVGLATSALEGSFFTFGSRTIGVASNIAKAVPMALAAVTSNIGSAMTAWGRLGGKVEEGDGIFTRMGKTVGNAGMDVRNFGADMTDAVASVPAWQAALGAVAVAGYAFLAVKAVEAANALDKWSIDAEHAVQSASNLKVLPTIAGQWANASDHLASAQTGLNKSLTDTAHISAGVESRYTGLTIAQERANAQVHQATSVQNYLSQAMKNTLAGAGQLERVYGTSFVGALELADQAGVHLAQGITGTGEAATINRLKIANYVAGMKAMGETSTSVGHDVTLLGIDAAESATKVQQLNQAFSDFVGNMTGGTQNLASFNQSLTNLTKGANNVTTVLGKSGSVTLSVKDFAQSLTRFTGQGAQAWQNFDSLLTGSASQLVQWFQRAGSEGAVQGPQFTKALLDMASSFTPLAAKSQTAQKELVGFFNAAGLNIKNFADLKRQIDAAGGSGKDLAKIVQDVTGKMSDLNGVAKALGSSVGSDVVAAMNNARIAASNLGQSAQNLASAWNHAHSVNQSVISGFQQTFNSLMDVYHNTNLAKQAVDALAQQMGMTQGQINQLNGMLSGLSGHLSGATGQAHGLAGAINALQSKTITITTLFNSVGSASIPGGGPGGHNGPLQAGTMAATAGFHLVGERGPEMVLFGGGETVLNNADTRRFMDSPGSFGHPMPNLGGAPGGGDMQATIHNHVYLDGQQVFESVKTQTARYNVRNGNPQSGRLSPGV